MYKIGPLEREKIARIQDIPSRARLAQVSKEWQDAVETTWGPAVYNLPFCHRQPVGAPDWKKACRLRHMAAGVRPEDIDATCVQMALVAAQLDGRAGSVSGETFILKNLVRLGSYKDALRYLEMYPVTLPGDDVVVEEVGTDAPVDLGSRRIYAKEALNFLLSDARPCDDLVNLAKGLLAYCDESFSANLAVRAAQGPNPALHIALSESNGVHAIESVYAELRDALARLDLNGLKACIALYEELGRPALGPLLDAVRACNSAASILRALFEADITGAPCVPSCSINVMLLLRPETEEAARFRALFSGATDARGATWMHHLLQDGRTDSLFLARALCATGASLLTRNCDGKTPLRVACNAYSESIARLLKNTAATGPWPQGFEDLRTGQTHAAHTYWSAALQDSSVGALELLRCAALFGDAACVRLALQHAEARDDVDIALKCAVHGEHSEVIELLLSHGANYTQGLKIEQISANVVRDLVETRMRLTHLLGQSTNEQRRMLCEMHTHDGPLVDMAGMSLPAALLHTGRLEEARALWARCDPAPVPADALLEALLSLPITPDVSTPEFLMQQKFALEMLDKYPGPLDPDTSFSADLLASRLSEPESDGRLKQLQLLWRAYHPENRAATRVSALACALFFDLTASVDSSLTKQLADRGLRLLPGEHPVLNAWLKASLRGTLLITQYHDLILACVRGGLNPRQRGPSGRTILHLCRYADIYDSLVAAGADPHAMDFNEQIPKRPTELLHGVV